ncbi:MAG: ArsC/Spx/MgsR family protein, partial [Thermomicrobiales bacterium]
SDDDLVGLMAAHPALIRRPITIVDGRAIVGFSNDSYDDMAAALRASRSGQE